MPLHTQNFFDLHTHLSTFHHPVCFYTRKKYFLIHIHISVHFVIQYAPTHAKKYFLIYIHISVHCVMQYAPTHAKNIFWSTYTSQYIAWYKSYLFIRMKRGRRKINSKALFIRFYVKCFTYVYYTTFYKRQSVTLNVTRANSIRKITYNINYTKNYQELAHTRSPIGGGTAVL